LRIGGAVAALALAVLPAGCGNESSGKTAKRPARAHLVELFEVKPGHLSYTASRAGSLRALREVKIVNEEEGRLTEVAVREGDRVAAGDVLARYDDRILRAQLDKAAATRKQAEVDYERNRQMKAKGFVSDDAVSRAMTVVEIARAEERLLAARVANMTLSAPFDGVVDINDLNRVRDNFGNSLFAPGALTAVPEPATAGLAVCGLIALAGYRHRRRHA